MGQVVPSDVARQMLPGLRSEFNKKYKGVPVNYDRVTLVVPSTHLSQDYGWLGELPQLREFGAERIPKGLSEYKYTIKNRKWKPPSASTTTSSASSSTGRSRPSLVASASLSPMPRTNWSGASWLRRSRP